LSPAPSSLSARQFGQILPFKQKHERFLVGRRGEPPAIIIDIIGIDDYINTFTLTAEMDAEITTARRERRRNTPLNIAAK
jgi:hypothetical protein